MTELLDALPYALAATSFALGARHGLDWDHIAAIADLTAPRKDDEQSPQRHARRGMGLSFWYCAGHGLVLAVLGALILALGIGLPAGMDVAFEYLVGVTLITLGGVVLYQLARRTPRMQIGLGAVTGVASLTLGLLIMTGYSGIVPPLVSE